MAIELSDVMRFTGNCIYDDPAPCACVCPFSLNLRSFLKKVSRGRMPAAYRELRTATVFPTLACRFCTQPCREKCQRELTGDAPLNMKALEEAVLRLAGHQTPDAFQVTAKDAAVAVVGAGPAGLSLALAMAQKKYPVTVFDAAEGWGGSLRQHPEFPVFDEDFRNQFSLEQVNFVYRRRVESLDELAEFSAVYIATGADGTDFGLKDSFDPETCCTARRAVFLGGGLVGMDIVQSVAAGGEISRLMEGAIQTGRPEGAKKKPQCPPYRLIGENEASAPIVLPADPSAGYTMEEAKAEAARCMQCACTRCMTGCELMDHYKKPPEQCAMEVMADCGPHFLASRTMTRETYSCNLCGNCGSNCPEQIDMGELFRVGRAERRKLGIEPEAFHDFYLRDLAFSTGEAFYAYAGKTPCEYAFFPGCELAGTLPEQTLAAFRTISAAYSCGVILSCCGAPAAWAGAEAELTAAAGKLKAAWESMGKPTVVYACASCRKMLARFLPEIPTVSLYSLLDAVGASAESDGGTMVVFDPCAARENDELQRSIRALALRSGTQVEERAESEKGRCCGYGGHMKTANPALYRKIAENRAGESGKPYLVYCANCRSVFLRQNKPCRHILETLFGAGDHLCTIAEKRANRLFLKGELIQQMEQTVFTPEAHPWDAVSVFIPDEVRLRMEDQLISDDDVKQCICEAKDSGYFVSDEGHRLASLVCRVITYWVEFTENADGTFRVWNAYSHRMHFDEET